jgi:hypothetical protein
LRSLWLASVLLGGCYQSIGAGYVHRFAEHGGDGAEGYSQITLGEDVHDDVVPAYLKTTVAGGKWGVRGAGVAGVAPSFPIDDDWSFFGRPGLALLVIGYEAQGRDGTWVGVGLETDIGWRARVGDTNAIEFGLRGGADLSYTGDGSGAFAGAFLGFGWGADFERIF